MLYQFLQEISAFSHYNYYNHIYIYNIYINNIINTYPVPSIVEVVIKTVILLPLLEASCSNLNTTRDRECVRIVCNIITPKYAYINNYY